MQTAVAFSECDNAVECSSSTTETKRTAVTLFGTGVATAAKRGGKPMKPFERSSNLNAVRSTL